MAALPRNTTITQAHIEYLDALRSSGEIDLLDAGANLMQAFPQLDKREARGVLMEWLSRRHLRNTRK